MERIHEAWCPRREKVTPELISLTFIVMYSSTSNVSADAPSGGQVTDSCLSSSSVLDGRGLLSFSNASSGAQSAASTHLTSFTAVEIHNNKKILNEVAPTLA